VTACHFRIRQMDFIKFSFGRFKQKNLILVIVSQIQSLFRTAWIVSHNIQGGSYFG
jgi:hypothetical protein